MSSATTWASRFGPLLEPRGGATFRLWAPAARKVELVTDAVTSLEPAEGGWFTAYLADAAPGLRYRYRVDGKIDLPDPASHFQPEDLAGPSELIDHEYAWTCQEWRGRPWHEAILLELHVGTFTQAGTFRGAIERLDHCADTGITAIELMPLGDFPGRRNWGYDGVLLYAPDSAYGRPEDLKAFIDAAHVRGLMVFLDVVYNHFGPEGNYLGRYAPNFFAENRHTPWGAAIDYRVPEVRAFAIENALHWLTHYRFDGLRLDAVHAIQEMGEPPVLQTLSEAVGALAADTGRQIHLVLENDDNRATLLDPQMERPHGKYRAQWNDDYHHAWHVHLTGETRGYYRDYASEPLAAIARALAEGFVYQGEPSAHRCGAPRGEVSCHLPPAAFVNFLQNHDQIGNRAYGERLTTLAPPQAIEAALAITLLAPSPPLLFMGEEWGTAVPFPFFCDFSAELGEAVRRGRRAEFEQQFAGAPPDKLPPDPLSDETFCAAVLDWGECASEPHASRLQWVKRLLAARRAHIVPRIASLGRGSAQLHGTVLEANWACGEGWRLAVAANLGRDPAERPPHLTGTPIWGGEPPATMPPWSVYWRTERR